MAYIIFDLEFNQDVSSLKNLEVKNSRLPFEIIQIGAIKLDLELNAIGTFNRLIRPTFYAKVNPFVTELTGISTEQLLIEEPFPEIYEAYLEFIKETDSVFCTWGMSDMTVLFRNIEEHHLNYKLLPKMVIDLQPYVSKHFHLPQKNMIRLQDAVERLNISITHPFHNALNDAFYTAEVFKKIYNSSMQSKPYYPSNTTIRRPRQRKRVIDIDKSVLKRFN